MKTLNNLTEAELIALTEETLERLIDIECAERGIPMLPAEPMLTDEEPLEYDCIAYTISGYSYEFRERADAEAVAQLINGKPRAKYTYNGSPFYENEFAGWTLEERASVSEKAIMSASQRLATKAERLKRKKEKEEYDRLHGEFVKILNQRNEVGEEVRDRYWGALRRQRDRDEHRAHFARYLQLADGNREIAYRFFEKSYGFALTEYPELRTEFSPPAEPVAA